MTVTKENLSDWPKPEAYRKKILTYAFQIDCDATVESIEGPLEVKKGGWIATDSKGFPYPINEEIFAQMYEKA